MGHHECIYEQLEKRNEMKVKSNEERKKLKEYQTLESQTNKCSLGNEIICGIYMENNIKFNGNMKIFLQKLLKTV